MAAAAAGVPSRGRLLELMKVRPELHLALQQDYFCYKTPQSWLRACLPYTTSTHQPPLPSHLYQSPFSSVNPFLRRRQQLQSTLFSTTFNPSNARLGNKVLRQRLKGPTLAAYYPRKSATIEDIQKEFAKLDLVTWNEQEEDRLEGLQIAKLRGKGAPKKKRTADGEFLLPPIYKYMYICYCWLLWFWGHRGRKVEARLERNIC
jgi:small subunit ribosomal protein S33